MHAVELFVGLFMVIIAIGIAGIWTIEILTNPEIDRSRWFARAHDRAGSVMLPHWVAEYATALACLVRGVTLILGGSSTRWSWIVPIALGALLYTSVNSL